MLYNTEWEKKVKADPMSLDSLIAWLEKQPANGAYIYGSCPNCLLARYFRAMGYTNVSMGEEFLYYGDGIWSEKMQALPAGWNKVAMGRAYYDEGGHTFGKALERAKVLQNA